MSMKPFRIRSVFPVRAGSSGGSENVGAKKNPGEDATALSIAEPTQIYVPRIQYPNGFSTRIAWDDKARVTTAGQSVEIGAAQSGPVTVLIEPGPT
jgi:hypothetical protein